MLSFYWGGVPYVLPGEMKRPSLAQDRLVVCYGRKIILTFQIPGMMATDMVIHRVNRVSVPLLLKSVEVLPVDDGIKARVAIVRRFVQANQNR